MSPQFLETNLKGVFIINPISYDDERGSFRELFHIDKYQQIRNCFVQDNYSHSKREVLRGLHYQLKNPQGKLVSVINGEIFDVAVDIRRGSPSFGKWVGVNISSINGKQIYIPSGFAHGFCVLSDSADVIYKCTEIYVPDDEYGILWSDKGLGIDWPFNKPIISKKDSDLPVLDQISEELLPVYEL